MQNLNIAYNDCTAEITVKKNSLRKYQNNYYLKNGQEFEIFLRNTTQDTVMAQIKINGKLISRTALVLKPGQKVHLERYLDENKKFLFETYTVDNNSATQTAIANNGNIEVSFHKEKAPEPIVYYTSSQTPGWMNLTNYSSTTASYNSTVTSSYSGDSKLSSNLKSKRRISLDSADFLSDEVETGRVGKGSSSSQEFGNYDGQFESYAFRTVRLKILPFSMKPLEVRDIVEYCTNCGTKNKKGNYKYCPKCGNKFE